MSELQIHAYCGGLFQTNGYLVQSGGKAWAFDAPEGFAAWLGERGIRPEALLLTHQHHDHVLDVARIADQFGCPIYAHSDPSEELTLAKGLERMMGVPCPIDPYTIDHRFDGLDSIDLGGLVLDLFHVPGHSPDSVCFKLRDEAVLIGGDVLFQGSIGRTDFPNGDHELLLAGIRAKLWPLDDATEVLPGHGPTTTIGHEKATNPFLA